MSLKHKQNDKNYVWCVVCGKKLKRADRRKTWIYIMYRPYCMKCSELKKGFPAEDFL